MWKNIFNLLPPVLWPCIILMTYLNTFVLYLLMLFDVKGPRPWNFHSTTLTMFASNLQLSNSTYRPQGLSAKTFYIFMLFYGFLLVSQFNSFFIQVLTRGLYERQVSTIAEIIQRRLDVVGSLDTRSFFVNQTHDEVQA